MKKPSSSVAPLAQRATWARQPTPYDAPDCKGHCKDCGERLSTRDAEAGFTTCPGCAAESRQLTLYIGRMRLELDRSHRLTQTVERFLAEQKVRP